MKAVGLLFAGSSSGRALVSPLGPILNDFFPGGSGSVAGVPPSKKRQTELPSQERFMPHIRAAGGLPGRSAVASICRRQYKTLRAHSVLADLIANRTFVASYVGMDADVTSPQPRMYILVNTEEALAEAKRVLPSKIDGVPLSVQYNPPMIMH